MNGRATVWAVGALVRAVADALEARFNPVAVRGEISGFARAASGHCYFALKDDAGQLRCAMFRRAAGLLRNDDQARNASVSGRSSHLPANKNGPLTARCLCR
ncbi:MAG: exodeoxyribonuclease VII large subunit, partial [Hylemonella sp.]